jgi:two-component system response regulator YesN
MDLMECFVDFKTWILDLGFRISIYVVISGVSLMLKLLIVEDEKWEREGLLNLLDWRSFGLEVVETAVDGIEGLEMTEKTHPDIIITDIKMPGMDGISMSKQIKAVHPHVKIIILTGYDDFSFAREAIHFKADAYILKPLEEAELIPVLQKVTAECLGEKEKSAQEDLIKKQLAKNIQLAKTKFLVDLLEGRALPRDIEQQLPERLAEFDITANCPGEYFIMIIKMLDAMNRQRNGMDGIISIVEGILPKHLIFTLPFSGEEETVCCLTHPPSDNTLLRLKIADIFQAIHNGSDLPLVVGMGESAASLAEISQSYIQARQAVEFGVFWSSWGIVDFAQIDSMQRKFGDNIGEYLIQSNGFSKQLVAGVRSANQERCFELIREMFQYIKENQGASRDFIINFLQSMVNDISLFLCTLNKGLGSSKLSKPEQEMRLSGLTSVTSLETSVTAFIENTLNRINAKKNNPDEQIVKKVVQLIEERYMTDLGLQVIAREVFLSPNYLGNIFKKYTGRTFNDYLCEYRMEKAKELLQSSKNKVGWVASAVGISNTSYFCTIFKQAYGMAPGEYQETFLRNP